MTLGILYLRVQKRVNVERLEVATKDRDDDTPSVDSKMPTPMDVQVGQRLRELRRSKGLSQEKLAEQLGVTFQQIQKYERGANRIAAGRLYDLSRALDVTIDYFYRAPIAEASGMRGVAEERAAFAAAPDELTELIALFKSLEDAEVRRGVLAMFRALAGAQRRAPDDPMNP